MIFYYFIKINTSTIVKNIVIICCINVLLLLLYKQVQRRKASHNSGNWNIESTVEQVPFKKRKRKKRTEQTNIL